MSASKSYKPAHGGYPGAVPPARKDAELLGTLGNNHLGDKDVEAVSLIADLAKNLLDRLRQRPVQRVVDIPRRDAGGIVESIQVVGFEHPLFGTSYRIENLQNGTVCAYWLPAKWKYVQRSWACPKGAMDFMQSQMHKHGPWIPRDQLGL